MNISLCVFFVIAAGIVHGGPIVKRGLKDCVFQSKEETSSPLTRRISVLINGNK